MTFLHKMFNIVTLSLLWISGYKIIIKIYKVRNFKCNV